MSDRLRRWCRFENNESLAVLGTAVDDSGQRNKWSTRRNAAGQFDPYLLVLYLIMTPRVVKKFQNGVLITNDPRRLNRHFARHPLLLTSNTVNNFTTINDRTTHEDSSLPRNDEIRIYASFYFSTTQMLRNTTGLPWPWRYSGAGSGPSPIRPGVPCRGNATTLPLALGWPVQAGGRGNLSVGRWGPALLNWIPAYAAMTLGRLVTVHSVPLSRRR